MNAFAHAGHEHAAEIAKVGGLDPTTMAIGGGVMIFIAACLVLFLLQRNN